jgi:hypothetical protein
MRVIPVTEGASEYVWAALRETGGLDISADTVSVALGTYTSPGQWVTPADLQHPTSSTARAAYQVNSSTPPGRYWLWVRVVDGSETVPLRCNEGAITVI